MMSSEPISSSDPFLIITMGVSGCGKSTLGKALASSLSVPFLDADDLHPPANVAKMSAGTPLTDADRAPWLAKVRDDACRVIQEGKAGSGKGVVVACSALKISYREVLRGERVVLEEEKGQNHSDVPRTARQSEDQSSDSPKISDHSDQAIHGHNTLAVRTFFVHPHGSRDILLSRMHSRKGHFMKAQMLDSQLDTLEDPNYTGEEGIVQVSLDEGTDVQVREILDRLKVFGIE
ncbi:hypothetical protein EW146_g8108 [Bondarzewia mesenterica]|uniref:gluconokinase n=1 Tax=Bondarzewia mesenterica TaxID=1095465 RepID=A0A4S4LIW8_9AGAM|nr:hypothetical protein EW146_g8108 [Bondarzewia mesenterica]